MYFIRGDAGAHICYEIKMDDSGVTKRVNVGDIMLEGRQIFKLKMQLGATQDNPDGSAAHKSVDFVCTFESLLTPLSLLFVESSMRATVFPKNFITSFMIFKVRFSRRDTVLTS